MREARNAIEAILSAIDDSERSGLAVTGVMEDLVTSEDIAEKTGRSAAAVGHWTTGERGPGGFPAPVIHRGSRVKLSSWAQVSRWLADAGLGKIDSIAAEVAAAAADEVIARRFPLIAIHVSCSQHQGDESAQVVLPALHTPGEFLPVGAPEHEVRCLGGLRVTHTDVSFEARNLHAVALAGRTSAVAGLAPDGSH